MASIQRIGFTPNQNQLADIFKALGHPARLAIIETLLSEKRIMCNELAGIIPLAKTTVNRHTRVLFENGIIGYEKNENKTFYVLNPIAVETATAYMKCSLNQSNVNDINYSNVYFHLQPYN